MTQTDQSNEGFSYLGSEEKFRFLKDLEARNLVVPAVGNFSGPKALRAVGQYIRDHGATVTAFYLSNVESYLRREGSWGAFCSNVATMPIDDGSFFIRPSGTFVINGQAQGSFRLITTIDRTGQVTGVTAPNPMVLSTFPTGSGIVSIAADTKDCSK
jgi:hypothetical protein